MPGLRDEDDPHAPEERVRAAKKKRERHSLVGGFSTRAPGSSDPGALLCGVADAPNAAQADYWNAAKHWADDADGHDEMLAPLGRLAVAALGLGEGMRVLDVGCGTGATTRELAAAVGPSGEVVGVDVSALLLEVARARSAALDNLSYIEADVQTYAFGPGSFDRAYSRFGVMFFADPVAAFTNIRTALAQGGRMAFVCWQTADRNDWVRIPAQAVRDRVDVSFDAGGPNPFAFGDEHLLRRILSSAGFSSVALEARTLPVLLGGHGDLDTGLGYVMASRVGKQIVAAAPELADELTAAIRAALEPFVTAGGVEVGAAVWVATAGA